MSIRLTQPFPSYYDRAAFRDEFFLDADKEKIREKEMREQPPLGIPSESCTSNLFFGFFFDGTRNNYVKADATKGHSNVVRLYDCFPGQSVPGVLPASKDWTYQPDRYKHFFRVYIPGVASPFKEVEDTGQGLDRTLGGAFGWGGSRRIVWALVQAINNVNRYFLNQPLVHPAEAMALSTGLSLTRLARQAMKHKASSADDQIPLSLEMPRIEFEKLLRRLHANVSQHWKKDGAPPAKIDPAIVGTIYISTFGFSRGATQARAFANWLDSLCRLDAAIRGTGTLSLGGFPVVFDFLGLFDTVASVGLGNTFVNTWNKPSGTGHAEYADAEDSLRVPVSANKCVHLVAAHELRLSFPLDSIAVEFVLPERCEEIVFPGVHSDVGGGYVPMEHGKGTDADGADMVSRLPLLYMYRQARLAGVPLKLELTDKGVKARFETTPKTIKDFNAYIAACTKTSGRLTDIVREQAVLQMAWRYARRGNGPTPLHKVANFLRASTFDQNDLESANKDFEEELRDFEKSIANRGARRPQTQAPGFDRNYDNEWEEIATYWPFKQVPPEVLHFFDEYVHDSRAGFKLEGQDNEPDALIALKKWSEQLKRAESRYMSGGESASCDGPPDYGMNTNERIAAEEFERTGKLPRYYTIGRESYDGAKSGYFRFRKIFGGSDQMLLSDWHPADKDDPEKQDRVANSATPDDGRPPKAA